MGDTLEIVQGTYKQFPRQRLDAQGNQYSSLNNPSPFLGSDTLSCEVWGGDDTVVLATPSVAWIDVTEVAFSLTCLNADTAALSPGTYPAQAFVTRGPYKHAIDEFALRITGAPGTAAAPLAFTTLDDVLKYLPMVEDIQASSSQTGFREEQALATERLIDALVMLYQPGSYGLRIGDPGFNAMSMLGPNENPSRWLREQIVPLPPASTVPAWFPMRTNTLPNLIKPTVSTALLLYNPVIEIVAKWAVVHVLKAQVSRSSEQDWWDLAGKFERDANALFRARKFEVDLATPQTGWAGITIHGGASSLR